MLHTASTPALLRTRREGAVEWLIIDNPSRMNALSDGVVEGLRDALARVRSDPGIRALVITGVGRAFCVGADLADMQSQLQRDGAGAQSLGNQVADRMLAEGNPLVLELQALPVPVVCALNGVAAGAGVGIALAADLCVAARSAFFYLPFMPKLGAVPDLGVSWWIERLAGRARAMGLALLGDRLPAERAAQWGLIWDCVEDDALIATASEVAQCLARLPGHAAPELRGAFEQAASNTLAQQLDYEAARQRVLLDGAAFAEGVSAFLGKREPMFANRS
jgi:2-(1,2-epoxy-1,2-dihydrophenyl)acetyl-CoA isomerase